MATSFAPPKHKSNTGFVERPQLYSMWNCSWSWQVRIALNYKDIAYDVVPVNSIELDRFHEICPLRQTPVLNIDGKLITQSMAILHYLEEMQSQHSLLPDDKVDRAKVREICEIINSGIEPLQTFNVLSHVKGQTVEEWARNWIMRGLRAVDRMLLKTAGLFCVGDEITMADCCLVPQVAKARRFNIDMRQYPKIELIDKSLENQKDFRLALPYYQPDYPRL